jgi:hypothetical protein
MTEHIYRDCISVDFLCIQYRSRSIDSIKKVILRACEKNKLDVIGITFIHIFNRDRESISINFGLIHE